MAMAKRCHTKENNMFVSRKAGVCAISYRQLPAFNRKIPPLSRQRVCKSNTTYSRYHEGFDLVRHHQFALIQIMDD